ncbi:hypothetical protein ACFX13_002410 [Malus domestica]
MGNLIQESPKDEKVSALLAKDKPIHKWDDKDVDENDTTESWEDLDEPAPLRLHVNAINHRVPCNVNRLLLLRWECKSLKNPV